MSNYFNNFSKDKLTSSPNKNVPLSISSLVATCFLHGKSVPVPGTVGTLMAVPFAILMLSYMPFTASLLVVSILFAVGTVATKKYMKDSATHDPSEVIIDEFVAYLLITIFFAPSLGMFVITFALFRFFDAVKPFPIIWVDKKVDGALGVMLDDIAAAAATIVAYAIISLVF